MPPKNRFRKNSSLTKKQKMEVRKIASQVVDTEIEDKQFVYAAENAQLYHNKPLYVAKILGDIKQGSQDGDQAGSGNPLSGESDIRDGDQIRLKNINVRFWLSNKLDRPNVMYKGVLYWYSQGQTPADALVYKTQGNKMLDRYNTKSIRVIDTFIVKSTNNYAVDANNHEHSYLATLNKTYKNKLITYDDNGPVTKGWELGFTVVCYDAYGTLQTDNIASLAYNSEITFQDA